MKIGIIGAKGQVGNEFVKHLRSENLFLWDLEDFDICKTEEIDKVLSKNECDLLINLAAFHNTNGCEEDQAKAYAVNSEGAYNMAKAATKYGSKIVYISSDYVFGQEKKRKTSYVESDPVGPLNVYGASKVAGELMVRAMCPNHLIVRTSSLFGVTTSKKGWTFPEMIVNNARANKPLKVVTDQIMSPTYTYDLVTKIIELIEKNITGTIHICNGGECSWHEFATQTLKILGIDYKITKCTADTFPSPAERPSYSAMDSERLKNLGIAPMENWLEALETYLKEKGWFS